MAKKLPFKTQPQKATRTAGNDTVGVLEFPIYGDLTVNETNWISEQTSKRSTFLELARVTNKIAREAKVDPVVAHDFLQRCASTALGIEATFTKKEEGMKIKFAREIEGLTRFLLENQWDQTLTSVAALIRFRLKGMEDFEVDDAKELPNKLVNDVYGIVLLEQGQIQLSDLEEQIDLAKELGK